MKLLRIEAKGLPLFKEGLDIIFYAQQRVYEEDKNNLIELFSNVYLNPAVGFIGINASGKTTVLNTICLVLDILNNQPINHSPSKAILGNTEKAIFNTYYCSDENKVCKLQTVIKSEQIPGEGIKYSISDETLWVKPAESVLTRKMVTDFEAVAPLYTRNDADEFLPADVSIIIAYNKRTGDRLMTANLLQFTDINIISFSGTIHPEIIEFLDPTIERISIDEDVNNSHNVTIHLKFKGKDEIILHNQLELNSYLSSGTIKGIAAFTLAWGILASGGILVIDEIENHFNKEIVASMIRLFMDTRFNEKGGVLLYSTHYPELLDEYDRNDSIYITRNNRGLSIENLHSLIKRNDIKKSDAYQSGILEGTTPSYEAYIRLKKSFAKAML